MYELKRQRKLELLVKGPGPSCAVVARLPVVGKPGTNRLWFGGRPYGRVLAPGVYALELRRTDTQSPLGEVLIQVIEPNTRVVGTEPTPRCESAGSASAVWSQLRATGTTTGTAAATGTAAVAPDKDATPRPRTNAPSSGVLGQVGPRETDSPVEGPLAAVDEEGGRLLEIVLLAVALASAFALIAGLVGTLRRGRPRY